MIPNLVPKAEPENPSGSNAPLSINSLKALVANDMNKLEKAYEDQLKAKCEEITKLNNEKADLRLERDIYSDKCKALGRENSKQMEIIAEQEGEIGSLKAGHRTKQVYSIPYTRWAFRIEKIGQFR